MPVIQSDDKVWFDEAIKRHHICDDVFDAQNHGHGVLLLSHFEATLAGLSPALREKGIRHERFSSLNPSELCRSPPGKVWLGLSRGLPMSSEMATITEGAPLQIIVAEHHPMQSRDQEVIDAAAKLACDAQVCFYFSLDDPVMKFYGSETIKALLERLGIPKDEGNSHHLFTKAIRNAQEKIESKVGRDVPNQSAEDWVKYNLPAKK